MATQTPHAGQDRHIRELDIAQGYGVNRSPSLDGGSTRALGVIGGGQVVICDAPSSNPDCRKPPAILVIRPVFLSPQQANGSNIQPYRNG